MVAVIFVILFILGIIYIRIPVYTMIRNKDTSVSLPFFVVVSFLFLVIMFAAMFPRTGNIFYRAFLDVMPTRNVKGEEVNEGFLLESPYNPDTRDTVITRDDLLQRLHSHIRNTTLPFGLTCEANDKVSVLAVESYLKRLLLSTSKTMNDSKFREWVRTTRSVFSNTCKERKILGNVIDTIRKKYKTEYSMNELRTVLEPLLQFYDTARIGNDRFRSREEVNQITGIPVGEREGRNETALKGINAFKIQTSSHDLGASLNAPTDRADPFSYVSVNDANVDTLPTQTNELETLTIISNQSIPRMSVQTRGSNS